MVLRTPGKRVSERIPRFESWSRRFRIKMKFVKILSVLWDIGGTVFGIFFVWLGIWALQKGFELPLVWWITILFGAGILVIHVPRYFWLRRKGKR